jgi:hypothetical protein
MIEALRVRGQRIQEDLLVRIYGIADPTQVGEHEYVVGLRASAAAGIAYAFDAMEAAAAGAESPEVPSQLLVQAQLAARNEVSLDTVLRRYFSGNTIITDMLLEESERAGLSRDELKRLLRGLAAALDRLLARVGEEYTREAERRPPSGARGSAEIVGRLLSGELQEASELRYSLECWHLGLVCSAANPATAARALAGDLNRALLLATPSEDLCWAWLGGSRPFDPEDIERLVCRAVQTDSAVIAFGEPAHGLSGWRLTHRQAASALPVARRSPQQVSRYSEVSLIASALHDELLSRTLRQLFLEPLGLERDEGRVAKRTLRAYFDSSRNVSSTAAALGVTRRTVSNRLAAIEKRVGRPLSRFSAEIETAIRLEELDCQ